MNKLYILTFLLLLSVNIKAQTLSNTSPENVGLSKRQLEYADKAIQKQIDLGNIPGAVLAIVKDGKMPYLKAYGLKETQPKEVEMKIDAIFDIASCTKAVVTAISTMILVERGELSLRDNLNHYIPDFNKNKTFEDKHYSAYIRNLLTHTSGLPAYVTVDKLQQNYDTLDINAIVDYAKHVDLCYQPGENMRYSCINFILLQYIIEQVTGQSLSDFAKENIFDILKMSHTGYLPLGDETHKAWAKAKQIVPADIYDEEFPQTGLVQDPLAREINKGISGNAGVFSTASDLATLCAALLNSGSLQGKQILSPMSVRAMTTVPKNLYKHGRAHGWDVNSAFSSNMGDLFDVASYGHSGHTGCSITLDKENNMAIILLTNATQVEQYDPFHIVRLRAKVANCVAASIKTLP